MATDTKIQSSPLILIVDDNLKNIQVLGNILRAKDYKVEFATSGNGGMELLKEYNFDLLLLDVMMPEMDGFEVCKRIRADKKYNNLPILFLTAKTDKDSLIKGFEFGAQDYITKPFDSEELLSRVRSHLELKFNREKLILLNRKLEKRVKERTEQLKSAIEELEELDESKSRFIRIVNHEIRTPLNGIRGSVQLLKIKAENKGLEELIEILESSVSELEMFSLTTILISQIRSKKYELLSEPVKIKEIIESCIIKQNDQIENKNITVEGISNISEIIIDNDLSLLKEIFSRLLENAVVRTPAGRKITINLYEQEDDVIFEIMDTGSGCPPTFQQKIPEMIMDEMKTDTNLCSLNLYLVYLIADFIEGNFETGENESSGMFARLKLKRKLL